ncbi:MAG: diaminopimelate epimerase [Actinomycetota bacterium]|nr:diaminopimelate epimerase [Actinomycetota bacterium]MDD5667896.1 diaminopimelate epimerase [Actinomycetota bacterium]
MEFFKYQGTGNDFVILDGAESGPFLSAREIEALCERHTGVGADGVIFACAPTSGADAAMRIFNADGSEAEMCGNGIRCLARYLYERLGLAREEMLIETLAGIKALSLSVGDEGVDGVEVDMGLPELSAPGLPAPDDPARPGEVAVTMEGGEELRAFCLSMGNPHCVLFVEDAAKAPVPLVGPSLEKHAIFPGRTNVEFAQIDGTHRIILRVWERGVGETLACGTGACAAAVAAIHLGSCESPVEVRLPGGALGIRIDASGHVHMAGPAVEVFRGEISGAWAAETRPR